MKINIGINKYVSNSNQKKNQNCKKYLITKHFHTQMTKANKIPDEKKLYEQVTR